MLFVDNAWDDDKNNDKVFYWHFSLSEHDLFNIFLQFARHQNQPYSNSVYQMFFFLNKVHMFLWVYKFFLP